MAEWLLDAHPLPDGRIALWVWNRGRVRCFPQKFEDSFYVRAGKEAWKLEAFLNERNATCEESWQRTDLRSERTERLLKVIPGEGERARTLAYWLNRRSRYRWDFYGLDPAVEQRFLQQQELTPFGRVRVENGCVSPLPTEPLDKLPGLRVARLELRTEQEGYQPQFGEPLREASLKMPDGGRWRWSGTDEQDGLQRIQEALEGLRIDVLLTNGGDSFHVGYLWHRAQEAGVDFSLGREVQKHEATRKGSSYASYGRVVWRAPSHHLWGRLHIDRQNSFLFDEGRLEGLMTLARLSGVPLQTLARGTPGSAISAMQIAEAHRRGWPVQWRKNLPEQFKTMRELAQADRGGYICDPEPGVHDSVSEVDFVSLYPSIMVAWNISPEALNCGCCGEEARAVPGLPYRFCSRREGIVPATLKPLLAVRAHCKALSRSKKDWYARVSRTLKWLLVTSFGYTGYRNARYGRIECHESIQAIARDVMLRSMNVAREAGYEIMHGIVDSLWLRGERDGVRRVVRQIAREVQLPLELEAHYRWVVFLPNRSTGMGALNRYYGMREGDGLKIRGIEARQGSTPKWFVKAQKRILEELGHATDARQFLQRIPVAVEVLRRQSREIRLGRVRPRQLVLSRKLSKEFDRYRRPSDSALAAEMLNARGILKKPGQRVRYLMRNSRTMFAEERVLPAEMMQGNELYDRRYYYRFLLRCGESVLLPFGWNMEKLDVACRRVEEEFQDAKLKAPA